MPYLCKAVLTAGYLYVVLVTINATSHLEDNDRDPAIRININDSNNNNYWKRQLKKYHWRQYELHQQLQQQQHHQHHHQDHTETLEVPRTEPLFEKSQEVTSSSGRARNRALRHHSRSSSSSSHRVSINNIMGAGDDDRISGVGEVASGAPGNQKQNSRSRLLLQDREMRIKVFGDIVEKLLQLSSREGSVQQDPPSAQPLSGGMLGLAMGEFWKEGSQNEWQQHLLQLYLQQHHQQQKQQQWQQQQKQQQSLAHKKPRHSIYVCPKKDSSFQLACPGLDSSGATICIRDTELCDGVIHCPDGEDENSTVCMFYTMIRNAINKVTQTLFENLPRK